MPTNSSVALLDGQVVVQWRGDEAALAWREPPDHPDTVEALVWESDTVPYLQFLDLDLRLESGRTVRLVAQLDDGSGYHGLYLIEPPPDDGRVLSPIYRHREVRELPLGQLQLTALRNDGPNAVVEAVFRVGSDTIRILAGEVYDQPDGSLRICEPDESLLVQVNGARPAAMA